MNDLWSWVLTLVGLAGFYFAGRKVWWAWYINIANQILWLAYSIVTQQWGFLVGVFFYTAVFVKNAYEWTQEHQQEKAQEKAWAIQSAIDLDWAKAEVSALRAERELIAELEIPMNKVGYCSYTEERLDPATGYDELFCTTHSSFSYYKVREGSLLPCILFESKQKEN